MQASGVDVKFKVITLSISIGNGILSGVQFWEQSGGSKFKSAD